MSNFLEVSRERRVCVCPSLALPSSWWCFCDVETEPGTVILDSDVKATSCVEGTA